MRGNDNVTKHIHTCWAHLEQFLTTNARIPNNEIILVSMNNMLLNHKTFISYLRRQPNLTLKFLIKILIQEKTLMKKFEVQLQITHQLFI
jgi:hypothetical protein